MQIRKDLISEQPCFVHPPFDYETRVATFQLGNVIVASIYVPNGGKDFSAKMRFLEALQKYVAEVHDSGRQLILCGDMNVARAEMDVHPKERNAKVIGQRPDERALIERILSQGLVDIGRAMDPDNDQLFTWWAPWRNMRQRNIGWRLDYLFVSSPLVERFSSCKVLADVGTSDHAPVLADFALS